MSPLALGDRAEDTVTGYRGIVVAFSQHLAGCDRVTLQAPAQKDGTIPEAHNVDVLTVQLVAKAVVTRRQQAEKPGGPPTRARRG